MHGLFLHTLSITNIDIDAKRQESRKKNKILPINNGARNLSAHFFPSISTNIHWRQKFKYTVRVVFRSVYVCRYFAAQLNVIWSIIHMYVSISFSPFIIESKRGRQVKWKYRLLFYMPFDWRNKLKVKEIKIKKNYVYSIRVSKRQDGNQKREKKINTQPNRNIVCPCVYGIKQLE